MSDLPGRASDTVVIGCGNLLCGDDAVGPTFVRRLLDRGLPAGIRCLDLATDGIAVIEAMRGVDRAVFVDVCASGAEPGTIHELPGSAVEDMPPAAISVHSLRWSHAIAGARRLLGDAYPRQVTVWLVEGAAFEPGDPITPAAAAAVDRLIARLAA